jgi:hypothetical protein
MPDVSAPSLDAKSSSVVIKPLIVTVDPELFNEFTTVEVVLTIVLVLVVTDAVVDVAINCATDAEVVVAVEAVGVVVELLLQAVNPNAINNGRKISDPILIAISCFFMF